MRAYLNELFSSSAKNTQAENNSCKIELVSCPSQEKVCIGHLTAINQSYVQSEQQRKDKDFYNSIETLKHAFNRTNEMTDSSCVRCSELFRTTITDSLKNIKDELGMMTSGFMGNKRYQLSYIMADKVLQEFQSNKINGNPKPEKRNGKIAKSLINKILD